MKLLHRLLTEVPLICDGQLAALLQAARIAAAEHPIMKGIRERMKPTITMRGNVAIVPIEGVLARKPDPFELFNGVEDSRHVLDMVDSAANNADAKGILLDFDSPGGFVTGGPEIADAVRNATKRKPVVAFSAGTMASLAYWIGSQSNQVVASRSAVIGSIGVYTTHVDYTKMLEDAGMKMEVIKNAEGDFKAVGLPGTSLSETQRAHLQDQVQASFNEFRTAVKSSRPWIRPDAMRGQTFTGTAAKAAGLVDRVGDMGFALSALHSLIRN
jgi:signal peptide peptidase SppA